MVKSKKQIKKFSLIPKGAIAKSGQKCYNMCIKLWIDRRNKYGISNNNRNV